MHDLDLAMLILRIATGGMIFMHGYNHFFGGGRLPGAGRWFDSLGIHPGYFHAWVTAVVEVGSGVLLVAGFLTPIAAAGVVGILSTAIFLVHRHNGFFILKEGWEYAAYIIVGSSVLGILGPGRWSLDHAIGWHDVHGWVGLAWSLGLGVVASAGLIATFWRPVRKSEAS